ncbi:hypothetical protein HMPREF0080_00890 [Anaeroglobus geminatus F0357]|uniref:Uncharacterized protein n=1 Tax=Anaeroglobus geminatus F0357 TaxID=861450 RepID=G9YGX0_9FIRM|nr:hypothetical protein HMPREF0080_00890 [Anaeroglobus geminatus F0357]
MSVLLFFDGRRCDAYLPLGDELFRFPRRRDVRNCALFQQCGQDYAENGCSELLIKIYGFFFL